MGATLPCRVGAAVVRIRSEHQKIRTKDTQFVYISRKTDRQKILVIYQKRFFSFFLTIVDYAFEEPTGLVGSSVNPDVIKDTCLFGSFTAGSLLAYWPAVHFAHPKQTRRHGPCSVLAVGYGER